MTDTPPPQKTDVLRRRLQMLLVAALFLGPLALAFWAYYGVTLRPSGRTNVGELVTPARPLADAILPVAGGSTTTSALLRGHWSLVVIGSEGCDGECQSALAMLRSVRLALGSDATRVKRVLLVAGSCCAGAPEGAGGADLLAAWLVAAEGSAIAKTFEINDRAPEAGRTFIVDPLGNLMMSYPAGAPQQGVLRDLEHLLKLSHIG